MFIVFIVVYHSILCAEPPKDESRLGNELDLPSLKILVVPTVAAKWKQFGIFLGVENVVVDKVKLNYPTDCERACEEMLKLWLTKDTGTGDRPQTWATVIDAMEMVEFKEQAQALRDRLLRHTTFETPCSGVCVVSKASFEIQRLRSN